MRNEALPFPTTMLLGASLSSERGLHGGLRSSQGEGVWISFVSLHCAWATERGVLGEPAERFIPEDADGRYSQSIERVCWRGFGQVFCFTITVFTPEIANSQMGPSFKCVETTQSLF